MSIVIRDIELVDRKAVWEWRNDPAFASMLPAVTWTYEDHCRWFDDLMKNEEAFVFIGIYKILRIGVARFNRIEKGLYEVTIMLKPAYSTRRLIHQFITASIEYLRIKEPGIRVRIIQSINTEPLRKVLGECGFIIRKDETNGLVAESL